MIKGCCCAISALRESVTRPKPWRVTDSRRAESYPLYYRTYTCCNRCSIQRTSRVSSTTMMR